MILSIILKFLSNAFDFVLAPFKIILSLLKTNPKIALSIIAVIAAAIIAWRAEVYVSDLNTKIETEQKKVSDITVKNTELQTALSDVTKVNVDNQRVISDMIKDAEENKKRIADLNTAIDNNTKKYNNTIIRIKNAPKADDGPVAKVLRDTIQEIQNKRNSK